MDNLTKELIKDIKERIKTKDNFVLEFIGENKIGMSEATLKYGENFNKFFKELKEAKKKT